MDEPEDVLSRELVIGAKLDENGVAVRIKSRAGLAIDRLIGSLVDIPTAFAEGVASKKRLRDHIQERLLRAQADVAERKLQGLPHVGDDLLIDLMKDAARKQGNAASVAFDALGSLKALPPPSVDAEQQAGSDGPASEQIDEDWMNQFTRFAEDASSDDLQQLWGRVLAGEINRAGSFSRHTLRFIAELDKVTAQHCEYAAERAVGDWIPKTDEWSQGEGMLLAYDLQRLGLLEGVGGLGPAQSFEFPAGYKTFLKGTHALVVYGEPDAKVSVNAMILTRMGKEVFSLLSPPNETVTLRRLAPLLQKPGVKRIELGSFIPNGAEIRFTKEETIWEES